MSSHQKINSGFVALVVVVIVGVATLTLALSTALLGLRELEVATTTDRGVLAKMFTDGCLDTALLALRLNPAPGGYEFTNTTGRCIITIRDEGSGDRQVVAQGFIVGNDQSIEVHIT